MKFSLIAIATATAVYAAPQLNVCFDNFDCILSGFNCQNL